MNTHSLPDFWVVAPEPEWIAAIFDSRSTLSSGGVKTDHDRELDLSHNVFAAHEALQSRIAAGRVPISGSADGLVYETLCVMRDNGLSQEKAVELVWNELIPHAVGNFDFSAAEQHQWVELKAENAYNFAKSDEAVWAPPGPMDEEFAEVISAYVAEFKAVISAAPNELDDFNDFINDRVPPVEEIVPGWIEKGIPNFIVGRGGTHKSRLALQWGLCIQAGSKILGEEVIQCPLIYLSSEDDKPEITRRTQAISLRLTIPMILAKLMDRRGKPSAICAMDEGARCGMSPFYDVLVAAINSVPGHKFVVMDSCVDFVHFIGRAKIDDGSVNFFIKTVLQRLCDDTNCTLLVIWHSSKSGQETGAGWSVAWEDAPRSRMMMRATEMGTYELSQVKRNHGKLMAPIEMRFDNGAIMPLDAATADMEGIRPWLIKLAISQAEINDPFQRQRNVPEWVQERADAEFGYRPSFKQLKQILEEALRNKHLRYRSGNHKQSAGYCAWNNDTVAPAEGSVLD